MVCCNEPGSDLQEQTRFYFNHKLIWHHQSTYCGLVTTYGDTVLGLHWLYIDFIEYAGSCLIWGRISTTCIVPMWRNDTKCKYMFMFPLKNLARKGLMFQKMNLPANPTVARPRPARITPVAWNTRKYVKIFNHRKMILSQKFTMSPWWLLVGLQSCCPIFN